MLWDLLGGLGILALCILVGAWLMVRFMEEGERFDNVLDVLPPREDHSVNAEPVGEYLDPADIHLLPAGVVPPPTDTSRVTNDIAIIRNVLEVRMDYDFPAEPFDQWVTNTAVDILNALQK